MLAENMGAFLGLSILSDAIREMLNVLEESEIVIRYDWEEVEIDLCLRLVNKMVKLKKAKEVISDGTNGSDGSCKESPAGVAVGDSGSNLGGDKN